MRTLLAIAILSLSIGTAQAEEPKAFGCRWYANDLYWNSRYRPPECQRWRRTHYYHHRRHVAPSAVVPAIGSQHCPGTIINVVSGEHQGEEKAKGGARKMFMGEASTRHGLAYAALEFARHVRWRCFPAQAHDTWTGALSKAGNKIMGGDGQNVRCELWASPCSVPVQGD
jgi:hypothetical protein